MLKRPQNYWLMTGRWLANDWPMTSQWLANDWPMTGRWLADDWPDDCPMTGWLLADECMMTGWWLTDDWLITGRWMHDDWLMTGRWLADNWLMTGWWLLNDSWWMSDNWLMTCWQMPDECLKALQRYFHLNFPTKIFAWNFQTFSHSSVASVRQKIMAPFLTLLSLWRPLFSLKVERYCWQIRNFLSAVWKINSSPYVIKFHKIWNVM